MAKPKKIINDPKDVVAELLDGLVQAYHGKIMKLESVNALVKTDLPAGKVGLLIGGGSGHEPMHGGFVGMGMLDGACPGEVFTSPTPDQMYEAAKAVDGARRDLLGEAGEQARHAGNIAVVLARLIGAAEHHVGDGRVSPP